MTTRTRTERGEWTLAEGLVSGIPRARVALAGVKANHERAEGIR
ncbi:hypothetical protein [Haloplanus halophilus]|nr:hypothetical protein [Haloplanus sp. GDY1]